MSVFDLDQKGQQALADEARQNPLDVSQVEASAFTGVGKGIGMGLMKGGARVGQFVGMAGATVPMAIDKIAGSDNLSGKSLTEGYFEGLDATVNRAADYWTPAHSEVGKAGQVLGGLSEIILPMLAGGGNPAATATMVAGSQTAGTGTDLVKQGVDGNTAGTVAAIQGLSAYAGFKIPFLGNSLASRMGSGVAGNVVTNAGGAALQSKVLSGMDYTEQAKQFDPMNLEARAIDVLTGMVFGGFAHWASGRPVKPSEVDAVLTASNAKHFQQDTAPGMPANEGASAAHQSAIESAIEQLVRGERVNVADAILEADFVRPVPAKETPIAAAIREAYPDITAPRGVRNNNPGNIERGAQAWQGEIAGNDSRFATFETPEAGIRALAKNLIAYNDKHSLNTVEGIISRWAPSKENQTGAYVAAVAKELGVAPGDGLNVRDPATLSKLTTAIIRHENGGNPYDAATIRSGVDLALSGKELQKRSPNLSPEHQANESAVAQMSVTETARADAARMPDLMGLITNEDGTINPTQSQPFIRSFITNVVSPSEHGMMMSADGAPSQQGLQRIRNAVFAKAYGDPEIVAMMAESTDANVKNLLAGMLRAAPGVARLKDLIEAGARQPIDITGDLVQAVRQFSKIRAEGMTVDQFLAQQSLFDSGITPEVNNLLIGLQENARAPKRVAEMIGRVVDAVDQLGDPRQSGMFDSLPQPKPQDLIADAVETLRAQNEVKTTGDLFKSPELEIARQVAEQTPDMRVVLDDGSEVSAREALDRTRADIEQADVDVKAFEAAVTCYLRNIT